MRIQICLLAGALLLGGVGAAAETPPTYDRVSFSVSAERELAPDRIQAVLFVQRDGPSQAPLADEVNQTMRWAMERAREVPEIKASTGQYRATPVYNRQNIKGWRVRQTLVLDSPDAAVLARLLSALQSRLAMQSVDYTISTEVRRRVQEELLHEALLAFQRRAAAVATTLGRPGYRLVNLDLQDEGVPPPHPQMAMRAMVADAAIAEPVLEGAEQTVRVHVHGTVELELPR